MTTKTAGVPPPPRELSDAAKRWWRAIHAQWDLDDGARMLLQQALAAYDRAASAAAIVRREGLVVSGRSGPKPHPLLAVERDARQTLIRAWRALGLEAAPPDPAARVDALGRRIGRRR